MFFTRKQILMLGEQEADISNVEASAVINQVCDLASVFTATAIHTLPDHITKDTLQMIQSRINENVQRLR